MISRQRKYQILHRMKGLCKICSNPIHRSDLCEKHYDKYSTIKRASTTRRSKLRVQAGGCAKCATGRPVSGRKWCESCRVKQKLRIRLNKINRVQSLTCRKCGASWERTPVRGRPTHLCLNCHMAKGDVTVASPVSQDSGPEPHSAANIMKT